VADDALAGLDWWTPGFTRLVQFGDGAHAWALSVRDWRGAIAEALRRYDGPVGMWNEKFDRHALEVTGLPVPAAHRIHDGRNLHHLTNPPLSHGLKPVAETMFGPKAVAGQSMLKQAMAKNGWDWATVPVEFPPYWQYAALDTAITALAVDRLIPEVQQRGMWPAYEREMAYSDIMYRAERRGLRIDPHYTLALYEQWDAERQVLLNELNALGVKNPSSGAQVADALSRGGWDPEEFTDTGLPKTSEAVLKGIVDELGVPSPVAAKVLRYRRIVKWNRAYLQRFLEKSDSNWHVHPSINTMAARTGRSSVTGPPLQTLPARTPAIKHCILPEEGDTLWTVDYSGQELRFAAHFSGDQAMIDVFNSDDPDLHRAAARAVYGPDFTPGHRAIAKNFNFASLYGAGAAKIAATAGVTEGEVRGFITALESSYPRRFEFVRELDVLGRTRLATDGVAYVWTTGGRYMPSDPDKIYSLLNYLIQGSASDLLKDKTIHLDAAGYGDWIMLPVHDELVFSVPPGGEVEMPTVQGIMEEHTKFALPITCDVKGPYSTWGWKLEEEG